MSTVSLIRCEEYILENVEEKIKEAIDLLGGIEKYIKKDSRVFIKLNCVGPFSEDLGITTHPVFVEAVVKMVLTQTKNIIIGDNPATKDITFTLKKNGVYPVIEKYGLKILEGKEYTTIHNSNPDIYSEFQVSKQMIDCDTLINLPKMKTHTLTYMTCAQKNYFGLIFGLQKAGWHVKASNPLAFSNAFNDLYGALLEAFERKTILNICDGILGLEGEGPSSGGTPVKGNAIIASTDAISLDTIACKVAGLDTSKLILTPIASSRGYGETKNIQVFGNKIEDFNDVNYKAPETTVGSFGLRLIKRPVFRNILLEHPIVDTSKCIKCGECAKICPPHTMKITPNSFPKLKTSKCIRCWCCAEVCPKNAIKKSKRPIIGRIVF